MTVKVNQGVINSFRPGFVSSLARSLFPLFSLLSEERKLSLLFTLQHPLLKTFAERGAETWCDSQRGFRTGELSLHVCTWTRTIWWGGGTDDAGEGAAAGGSPGEGGRDPGQEQGRVLVSAGRRPRLQSGQQGVHAASSRSSLHRLLPLSVLSWDLSPSVPCPSRSGPPPAPRSPGPCPAGASVGALALYPL